jgi:hypothetical protein
MTKKILLAGVLGGILMFLWEGFAHEVLPLGEAGISALDNEAALVAVVKDTVKRPGFYIFPGGEMLQPGLTGAHKEEVMKKAMEQWRAGPTGIMIVHPEGSEADSPMQLVRQCLLDIGVTLLAALLLSMASLSSFGARLLFVSLIGLVPTLNSELPYWNWYGFPSTYVFAQGFVHLMGFVLAGLVVAKLMKPVPPPAAAARLTA